MQKRSGKFKNCDWANSLQRMAPGRLTNPVLTFSVLDVTLGSQGSYHYNCSPGHFEVAYYFYNPLPHSTSGIYSWLLQSETRSHTHGAMGKAGLRDRWPYAPDRQEEKNRAISGWTDTAPVAPLPMSLSSPQHHLGIHRLWRRLLHAGLPVTPGA